MPIARVLTADSDSGTVRDAAFMALTKAGHQVVGESALRHFPAGFELECTGVSSRAVRRILSDALGKVDLIVSDRPIEVPRLFVSDMDSTVIGQECIDELADFAGLKDQVARITERAMRGELDFAAALMERVQLLRGLTASDIAECLATRIRPNAGAKCLLATLQAKGCRTVLVTGGFHHFADPVAAGLRFDRVVANRLEVEGDILTGRLNGPVVDAEVKRASLLEEAAALTPSAVTMAAGDGANDAFMLDAATLGIACHAKPAALTAANGAVWGDLTAILRLLDIPQHDWVDAGA